MADMAPHPFEWLLVIGSIGAFFFSFGTGSNDVANAFATSVGSGTLTMNQAIFIAACFEFTGSLVLGQTNVNTIVGGIADKTKFNDGYGPYLFCYGMVCALWVGGAFQVLASWAQLNVSATHSIIGGIIGFALAHRGSEAVIWESDNPNNFPPYGGVVPIVITWFFNPIICALVSYTIFVTVRTFVLRSATPVKRSYFVLPILVFVTIWINCYFVLTKGAKAQLDSDKSWSPDQSAWVAAAVAGGCTVLSVIAIPFIMVRVQDRIDKLAIMEEDRLRQEADMETNEHVRSTSRATSGMSDMGVPDDDPFDLSYVDDDGMLSDEDRIRISNENKMDEFDPSKAEVFNHEAEVVFSYLQVCTAIAVIFAHGANEVGYATGPLSTIWDVINNSNNLGHIPPLAATTRPPYWIIVLCGVGLVSGLACYGQRLTMGVAFKLAKLSASRGFSAELATAIVITISAQYGFPTSSSQCITGAIVGVGMAEGAEVGVNWKYFIMNFTAWLFTLVIMGLLTAAFYAQGAYAPMEVNP